MLGSFTFILHTHLPYVLHHGKWPHGSDWLSEATAECYLPILASLERLQHEGLSPRISMDFSPINLEQLADPAFIETFTTYCDEKITAAEKDYVYFAKNAEAHLQPLALFWKDFYERAKQDFLHKYDGNVVTGFRRLADAGILDAMTCGVTHGYFPLLLRDNNIRAQLRGAIATHEEHFGVRPRGIWLPECGYRPRYKWSPVLGPEGFTSEVSDRAGIEELLAEVDLEYFVIDGAMTRGGRTVPAYQPLFKELHERYLSDYGPEGEGVFKIDPNRSLADIYWVNSSGRDRAGKQPAVFSRDPETAGRVWAADMGYPGAGVYLDFHKKHHNSGLRYWSVTGARVDLGDKVPYDPYRSEWQLDWDSDDFIKLVNAELVDHIEQTGRPGIIASPFDTELFGHWWFEGPRFLEKVLRAMSLSNEIKLTDCAEALTNYSFEKTTIALPEGSWGEGGHHYVWANKDVAWTWDTIYPLEDRFLKTLEEVWDQIEESTLLETIMKQAARELLLLESSDWQFVISTGGAIDYSKERFAEHSEFLSHLLDMAERYVAGEGLSDEDGELLQRALIKDRPFENIDLAWWRTPVTS